MSTLNPFDLLGDVDIDDPSQLIAVAQKQKVAAAAPAVKPVAKLPTKPVPPSQAVRDARNANNAPARGGAGRGGSRGGRGGRFQDRDFGSRNENGFSGNYGGGMAVEGDGKPSEHRGGNGGGAPRQSFRGGARHGGFGGNAEGDAGGEDYPSRRPYERRSGTGRGYEMKREGAGRANWGNMKDDVIATQETKENASADEIEKPAVQEDGNVPEGEKDNTETAAKEEKAEEKEMTLEEYEKIREEKRKALLALKTEERKVTIDKELESMQLLSVKKTNDEVFAKLGAEKESKKKESEREEKAKKSLSIHEFLKPAAGERSFGGRGRGRGGRSDGGGRGGGGSVYNANAPPPAIGDNGQFPTLGGKN